ncbi:MAG: T9SS type A sorting domain-containing protein [Balneola sp.]
MRKFLFTISFVFLSFPMMGQGINPNYFHDLSGFEDSTGTTQLFYRLYEPKTAICTYQDDNGDYINYEESWYNNHMYHLNMNNFSDSILVKDYYFLQGFCEPKLSFLEDIDFVNRNPAEFYQFNKENFGSVEGTILLVNPDKQRLVLNSFLDFGAALDFDDSTSTLYFNFLDWKGNGEVTHKLLKEDSVWAKDQYTEDDFNSDAIPFSFVGFNSFKKSFIIANADSLFYYFEGNKELIYTSGNGYLNSFGDYLIDADSTSTYLMTDNRTYSSKSDIFLAQRNGTSWSFKELLPQSNSKSISISPLQSGQLYLSDTTKVFFSENYGDTLQEILEFEEEVTGLYKKPNSDILYVLTRTDLYKVENGQPTSIKQVPVSNEETPEIPNTVSLKQNYPNPFNPTTTIEFELDKSTFTKLTVYDVLGRKVQELVNEIRPAGTNIIKFNATNLASGVYLYRLEADGVVQTKRLMLIK